MKRSRMICCGVKASTEDIEKRRPCPPPLDENRGAHNKYDTRGPRPLSNTHHHYHPRDSARSVDIGDLTVTLPGMVVGASNNHQTYRGPHSSDYSIHSHATDLKPVTKREKARQKLTNSLKRAKVLLSDNRTPSGSAGAHHNVVQNNVVNNSNTQQQPVYRPPQCLSVERFKVAKIKAAIDKKPTSIDERSTAVLKYRTPHFRAVAHVEVPCLRENQGVQIGWIQACTEMRFVNSYGQAGATSWEFPEIVSGKYAMIGDADGKQYPWYGSKLELQTLHGPSCQQTVTVHMNDNFFPQVTWYVPHPDFDKTPRLTHIHRKQKFYTFLVAKDMQTQQYHILNTIEWSMELNIQVDPNLPLGKRAQLIGPVEQPQPVILPTNSIQLEAYALSPPNANNAQTLIWRPLNGPPKMIVPPVESTMDMERYLEATKDFSFAVPSSNGIGVQLV